MPRPKITEEQRAVLKAKRLARNRIYIQGWKLKNPNFRLKEKEAYEDPEFRAARNARRRLRYKERKREQRMAGPSSEQGPSSEPGEQRMAGPSSEPCPLSEDPVSGTNEEQWDILTHILYHAQSKTPLRLFISGAAGTGKSFLIKILENALGKYCDVLLTAYTGKAASLIRGCTLHKALRIAPNFKKYEPLKAEALAEFRKRYQNLGFVIIDEISLISYEILEIVHKRLQELTESKKLFGGLHVLLLGDLCQLPCITRDSRRDTRQETKLYECNKRQHPLWYEFGYYELWQLMRQRTDPAFALFCRRLRVGRLAPGDYNFLCSKMTSLEDIPLDAVILQRANVDVDRVNLERIEAYSTERCDAVAVDMDEEKGGVITGLKQDNVVPLVVGAKYMLTRNVDVEDGLTNNVFGILRQIDYRSPFQGYRIVNGVWMEFVNGEGARMRARQFHKPHDQWTFIIRAIVKPGCPTYQFPLRVAESMTFYKAQGSTFSKVGVRLCPKMRLAELYVSVSRAQTAEGLFLFPKQPLRLPDISNNLALKALQQSKERLVIPRFSFLRQWKSVSKFLCMQLMYHRVESLPRYFNNIRSDFYFMYSDILLLTDTKDFAGTFRFPGFRDPIQINGGVSAYLKTELSDMIEESATYSSQNADAVTLSLTTGLYIAVLYVRSVLSNEEILQLIQQVYRCRENEYMKILVGTFQIDFRSDRGRALIDDLKQTHDLELNSSTRDGSALFSTVNESDKDGEYITTYGNDMPLYKLIQ